MIIIVNPVAETYLEFCHFRMILAKYILWRALGPWLRQLEHSSMTNVEAWVWMTTQW